MVADLVLAAEQTRAMAAPPIVYGLTAFAVLFVLILGVLMYGKGRPHS